MTTVDPAARSSDAEPGPGDEPSVLLLGYALTGGMLAWALHLWLSTSLVSTACEDGITWAINLSTVVLALVAAGAIGASFAMGRRVSRTAARNHRTHMLSIFTAIMNVATLALIILEGIPVLVISPCKLS